MSGHHSAIRAAVLLVSGTLGGCMTAADFPLERGFVDVSTGARPVTKTESVWVTNAAQSAAVDAEVRRLVKGRTIDADTAVRVALINNRGLQAAYADLGTSVAELWQESLPVNPTITLGASGNSMTQAIEGAIVNNLLSLATRGRRVDIAQTRVRQAQQQAIAETLRLAAETRRAYIEAAAAWGVVMELDRATVAADAAAELALELGRTGAWTKAEQARQQAFYAELTAETARARLAARGAKERLTRHLGLWGETLTYQVPNGLADLPRRLSDQSAIERLALENRADLKVAKLELEALAKSYGLAEATRYVSDLVLTTGADVEREVETEENEEGQERTDITNRVGGRVEVEFEIPIFDTGEARLRSAELETMRAANLLAERAVNVRSEARAAYVAYRGTYEIARQYRDAVVPLRRTIEAEAVLTYNGMITNTFDLLLDTRERINSVRAALEARRDFFLAEVDVTAAIYGGGVEGATPDAEVAEAGGGGEAE